MIGTIVTVNVSSFSIMYVPLLYCYLSRHAGEREFYLCKQYLNRVKAPAVDQLRQIVRVNCRKEQSLPSFYKPTLELAVFPEMREGRFLDH